LVEREWVDVLAWIPGDLDQLAITSGALRRRRAVRSGEGLLRISLAYSLMDLSLRSTAAWHAGLGLEPLSDVAILKRLRAAPDFLAGVLQGLLNRQIHEPARVEALRRVRLIDATAIAEPGSLGTDWRIHLGYDPRRGAIDSVELTDGKGSEHLGRAQVQAGDLILGDRGYAHAERIVEVHGERAFSLVRIGHSSLKLWTPRGEPFDPLAFASRKRPGAGRPPRVEGTDVLLRAKDGREVRARLIVVRKSREATVREWRRVRQEARKKGSKPTKRTLNAVAFTFLLGTLPEGLAEDAELAELYRVRWQVELAFKRLKSILDLGALRAKDPGLAKTYLYGKLIAAVLAETMAKGGELFPPWGLPLGSQTESLAGPGLDPERPDRGRPWPGPHPEPPGRRPARPTAPQRTSPEKETPGFAQGI
jgi:hypothetical protein